MHFLQQSNEGNQKVKGVECQVPSAKCQVTGDGGGIGTTGPRDN
jgi:hypothetical protein